MPSRRASPAKDDGGLWRVGANAMPSVATEPSGARIIVDGAMPYQEPFMSIEASPADPPPVPASVSASISTSLGLAAREGRPDLADLGATLDELAGHGLGHVELPLYAYDLVIGGRVLKGRLDELVA